MLIGSIILLVIGLFLIFCLEIVYEMTESWKNNASAEPSDLYRLHIRIGGIICTLIGVVGVVTYILL